MYLKGMHNNYGEKAALAENLQGEAAVSLRMGGQLLANLFELSADDVRSIAGALIDQDEQFDALPHSFSFVTARLAEGLYEEGEYELAESVAESVGPPEWKTEVQEYFQLCADNCLRPQHV
jgi:hypothetical protein